VLVLDLADDLLDQVLQRHQPRRAAVLVQHDRHLDPLLAHLPDQVLHRLALRHERGSRITSRRS
jgi:hypothetical protein